MTWFFMSYLCRASSAAGSFGMLVFRLLLLLLHFLLLLIETASWWADRPSFKGFISFKGDLTDFLSCHVTSCHVTSCHMTPGHVTSSHVTLGHMISSGRKNIFDYCTHAQLLAHVLCYTYALKTPRVVALPFMHGVEYIIISNQKKRILLGLLQQLGKCARRGQICPRLPRWIQNDGCVRLVSVKIMIKKNLNTKMLCIRYSLVYLR